MKAALVLEAGRTPIFGDFRNPVPNKGEVLVDVAAAALSPITKSRASGSHYSSSGGIPFVPGVDGVGKLRDGRRVYFVLPRSPFGAMAEQTVVDPMHCIFLPDPLDDVTAAAIANPGMSSWAALTERAKFVSGETVLINGATGAAGRLAVQVAKHLGARRIIATGRNIEILDELKELGAHETVPLLEGDDELETRFQNQFREGVDIVLDYLWGRSAEILLAAAVKAGKDAVPIRFVQIGAASGSTIQLPSPVLRSSAIQLMGSGIGSISIEKLLSAVGDLLRAAAAGQMKIAVKVVPLSDVERAWNADDHDGRVVFAI